MMVFRSNLVSKHSQSGLLLERWTILSLVLLLTVCQVSAQDANNENKADPEKTEAAQADKESEPEDVRFGRALTDRLSSLV